MLAGLRGQGIFRWSQEQALEALLEQQHERLTRWTGALADGGLYRRDRLATSAFRPYYTSALYILLDSFTS